MPNQLTGWRGNSGFWGESTTRKLSFADTWINSRVLVVRPVKLLKMIVWRGGTRSDRASHHA
jgi:hypothetical protein